jgi:hypothetical protein
MTTFAMTRDDQSATVHVNAPTDFSAMVFARARGYLSPVAVEFDRAAPGIDTIRGEERQGEETRAFWSART